MGLLVDRALRRTHRHLADGEAIVASLSGVEAEGRRRRYVLVTDRRIVVGWLRSDEGEELSLYDTSCSYDPKRATLTLEADTGVLALRDVDAIAARALVNLLANTRRAGSVAAAQRPPAVRLVQ